MAEGYEKNSEYYQSGDSISFGNGATVIGITSSTVGIAFFTIMFTKKIPTTLSISHNLSVAWIRVNGSTFNSPSATITITRESENFITITITTSSELPKMVACGANLSGTITFN